MIPYYSESGIEIYHGDALAVLKTLPDESVQTCVTSPPYWGLRDYQIAGQLGLEPTPELYVAAMVEVFREVRRVLRDDGTLWLNLGDSYAGSWGNYGGQNRGNGRQRDIVNGSQAPNPAYDGQEGVIPPNARVPGLKPKDLCGIPWRVAFALQADGWYLRCDIIWSKPNPMPESVTDRPTKAHEYLFLLSKSERYYYDAEAIKEDGTAETTKMPDGCDTGDGAHGSFHRNGREKGKRTDKQRGHGRRHDGFNDRLDLMTKAEQCALRRNKRSVWSIATAPFPEAHFATFPPKLIEPCILAGSKVGDVILDPFHGAGTTAKVCKELNRCYKGSELRLEYIDMSINRLAQEALPLSP